jgi:hypothetical protein
VLAVGDVSDNDDRVPMLLEKSDNLRADAYGQDRKVHGHRPHPGHFEHPCTPSDQASIESFFRHLTTENPHLDTITDLNVSRVEFDAARRHSTTFRFHEDFGYVIPEDQHYGRGEAIRQARKDGLAAACTHRIATRRAMRHGQPEPPCADGVYHDPRAIHHLRRGLPAWLTHDRSW